MEAIKFIKELKRYCDATSCEDCEAGYACNGIPAHLEDVDILESIEFIEKWSMDNPVKTRQSEFLKLHPDAPLDSNGCLIIKPCALNKELYNKSCENCKYKGYSSCNNKYKGYLSCNNKKYWSEEIPF